MSWDELEKRRTADIVNRRFGVSAEETVFVRDGYELTRYLLQCARQGRSRAAAIYPADEQETINQAVGDSLNGTRPLLLNQFIRPLRCRYLLQLPGRYGGMVAELEYLSPEPERARRMAAMEAALSRAAADIRGAAGPRDPLRFWGVTALTNRSLEPGLTLPGPLRCPCPPDFIRQHLRKGTML